MTSTATLSTWLENGDRLTQPEFHRRYTHRSDLKKAELIEGIVHLPSPVRASTHGDPEGDISAWLGAYRAAHPGLRVSHNATVLLGIDNELQPDVHMRRIDGGTSRVVDDYVVGPPELVVEIAASSAGVDLHEKKTAYRRNGVQEYIVWRTLESALDWWELVDGEYRALGPDQDGVIRSRVFPGLNLDVNALIAGDLDAVLRTLAASP